MEPNAQCHQMCDLQDVLVGNSKWTPVWMNGRLHMNRVLHYQLQACKYIKEVNHQLVGLEHTFQLAHLI